MKKYSFVNVSDLWTQHDFDNPIDCYDFLFKDNK